MHGLVSEWAIPCGCATCGARVVRRVGKATPGPHRAHMSRGGVSGCVTCRSPGSASCAVPRANRFRSAKSRNVATSHNWLSIGMAAESLDRRARREKRRGTYRARRQTTARLNYPDRGLLRNRCNRLNRRWVLGYCPKVCADAKRVEEDRTPIRPMTRISQKLRVRSELLTRG